METGTAVILIFGGVFASLMAYYFWDSWLRYKAHKIEVTHDGQLNQLTHEKAEMQERIEVIEDRLATLETIATDPARQTAKQIEELR